MHCQPLPQKARPACSALSVERALSVPQGSVHPSASRWKHRNKLQVAAGIAPHVHDGAMLYGTSMPAPLIAAPSDVHDAMPMDLLTMPHPELVHDTCTEPAALKLLQRVLDAIARSVVEQSTTPAAITTLIPIPTPTHTAQVRGGRIAESTWDARMRPRSLFFRYRLFFRAWRIFFKGGRVGALG